MEADLVVIGGGPAGLSAAITAASAGANVVVVDENPQAGGKLLGQLHEEHGKGWWKGFAVAEELVESALAHGVTILTEREVWGLYPGFHTKLNRNEDIHSPYVLIATGAAERAIPIPGWTIPGVMAVGAAQVLTNVYRVRPGNKVLIVGVDILSLTIARQMVMGGVEVVGIVLPPPGLFSEDKAVPQTLFVTLSGMTHLAPTPFLRLAGKMAKFPFVQKNGIHLYPKKGIRVWDVPVMLRKAAVEIIGTEQVEAATLADLTPEGDIVTDSQQVIEIDCVCISGGLYPLTELAATIGCQFTYLPEAGGHVPIHSPLLETTVDGIFVAGNITGVEGAKVAMAQGELAGTAIASKLGLLSGQENRLLTQAQEKVTITRNHAEIQFSPHIETAREQMETLWTNNDFGV